MPALFSGNQLPQDVTTSATDTSSEIGLPGVFKYRLIDAYLIPNEISRTK